MSFSELEELGLERKNFFMMRTVLKSCSRVNGSQDMQCLSLNAKARNEMYGERLPY
jgi:hypothetical protein